MNTGLRRARSTCGIGLTLLLASRGLARDGAPTTSTIPHVEIDRSAIEIDIASQRRSLDSSIRRALDAAAQSGSRMRDLAAARQRSRG